MKIKKYIAFNFDSGKMIAYDKPPKGIGGSKYKNPVIVIEAWITGGISENGVNKVDYGFLLSKGSEHNISIFKEDL